MATISYLFASQRTGFSPKALTWIRRRARRIVVAYGLVIRGCSPEVRALGIRLAVFSAADDWRSLHPGK